MLLPLVLAPLVSGAAVGLAYLFCYGGFEGPVDWAMNTASHGDRVRRVIALTFEERAGNLELGERAEEHPELCTRMADEGHELGNHTYSHRYLPLARSTSVADELARTDAAIQHATGITPTIARPPWGGRRPSTVRAFARAGKRTVLWDLNSYDW